MNNRLLKLILLIAFLILGVSISQASELPWLSTRENIFVNSHGKEVILRGFVVITNYFDGSSLNYQSKDYQRMKELGANYQSIRIGSGAIGAWRGTFFHQEYLNRLDEMIALGKKEGMYADLKLTIYDIRALTGLGKKLAWKSFWENKHHEQEKLIEAWKRIWKHYKDEPAIIGYDIFNEPEQGALRVSEEKFYIDYLIPFYQKAIDAFQSIDNRHYAIFQPAYSGVIFYGHIDRNRVIYAPHFYPNFKNYFKKRDFSTKQQQPVLEQFLHDAARNNALLLIGEYGMPWDPANDGNISLENSYKNLESSGIRLFDEHHLRFSRPWFADDKAAAHILMITLNCAVIKGTHGLDGDLRSIITDPFSSVANKH